MAYRLTKTYNNGYNCCCKQTWDNDGEWFDTLEEALDGVPTTWWDEIEGFILEDGSTGEEIGEGEVESWGHNFDIARYHGYLPDGPFEQVYIKGRLTDRSWDDVKAEYRAQREAERRQVKLREFERLKAELGES